MQKANFKEKLRRGDYQLIHEMTGYALSTVWQQLNDKRTLTDKVKEAAEKIIKNRENLLKLK
jgi:hypothetical protein